MRGWDWEQLELHCLGRNWGDKKGRKGWGIHPKNEEAKLRQGTNPSQAAQLGAGIGNVGVGFLLPEEKQELGNPEGI